MPATDSRYATANMGRSCSEKLLWSQYSYRTEKTYLYGVRQFILFNYKKDPEVMGNHESQSLLVFNGKGIKRQEYGRCECSLLFKSGLIERPKLGPKPPPDLIGNSNEN
jgi:hypothetical protein